MTNNKRSKTSILGSLSQFINCFNYKKINKRLKVKLVFFVMSQIGLLTYGQGKTNDKQITDLSISAFMDIFNVYDFNKPQTITRHDFLYNHNRHNEFNINLALLKFDLQNSKYRASFGLQTGTYVNDNMAAEPSVLKSIFEANIGISLNKKNNLWVDAGVLPSHIGFESAISMDNFTLTRSLLAENSPFFLTGVSLSFYPNDKFEVKALIVNGWQRIQRLEGNSLPSFGTQVKYNTINGGSLNWSTLIGTDDNDVNRRMRYFNNLYLQFQVSNVFEFITGVDFGFQQQAKESSQYDLWFSPIFIGQFKLNKKWKSTIRVEYFQDKESVITTDQSQSGLQLTGASINIDYSPSKNVICRLEGRWLNNKNGFLGSIMNPSRDNYILATSISLKLSKMRLNNFQDKTPL